MKIGLVCSENIKGILMELINSRGIVLDDQSDIFIVESSFDLPQGKICITFDLSKINCLVELLDLLCKKNESDPDTVIGRTDNDKYEVIPYMDIYYFEGRGNNTFCVTGTGEFRVKEKLYELEEKLPQKRFVRVSKSFIVNISNVKEIIPWFGRRLILKFSNTKYEIEVSRNYVKAFKEFLGM